MKGNGFVIVSCRGALDSDPECGVIVPAVLIADSGLAVTEAVGEDIREGEIVLTHIRTGKAAARIPGGFSKRCVARVLAVSRAYGIDWNKAKPILKKERAAMTAFLWAVDPNAAKFDVPCPRVIPLPMALDVTERGRCSDEDVAILAGGAA